MMQLLRFLDARAGEPSTWAALAAVLAGLHVNLDAGTWHTVSLYGVMGAGAIGILLQEMGTKPPAAVALDVVEALAAALPKPAAEATPAPVPAQTAGSTVAAAAALLLGCFGLAACSATQEGQALTDVQQACRLDAQLQPSAVALAPLAGAQAAAMAATDAALVHPVVADLCAGLVSAPAK